MHSVRVFVMKLHHFAFKGELLDGNFFPTGIKTQKSGDDDDQCYGVHVDGVDGVDDVDGVDGVEGVI